MKPTKLNLNQDDLFRRRLSNQLNPRHELFKLSSMVPWDQLETEFADLYDENQVAGRPAKPIRLMIGLILLQNMYNLSDESVVRSWVENPYWQYFCGYDYLQWEFPIDSSSLTRWRQRLGPERMEKILSMTISLAVTTGTIKKEDLEVVIADTTVMPKNITFPTDTKLIEKARIKLVNLSKSNGVALRQNYNRVSKLLTKKIGGYLHAKQMKRARRAMKHHKTIVGRVMRDCERQIENNEDLRRKFSKTLSQTHHLLERKRSDSKKIYSLHESHVDCISKGKAHKKYEFGCKVSLTITHREVGIITSISALHGNPFDGHTLKAALASSEKNTIIKVKRAFVDEGYKGHGVEDAVVYRSRQKKGVTRRIKREINRRQAIEPYIGHIKSECKLGLSRLKGIVGDKINAISSAAAYNLKLIINHLREVLLQILYLMVRVQKIKISATY
jgi:transposase, IS5 family